MSQSEVYLPSNKKFGFFFTIVCGVVSGYFYFKEGLTGAFFFGVASLTFFIAAVVKPKLLYPFNVLWMRLGLLLGLIVSPVVLGAVFLGIFTPVAFFMRLTGRDELLLKADLKTKSSYWLSRSQQVKVTSFKHQF